MDAGRKKKARRSINCKIKMSKLVLVLGFSLQTASTASFIVPDSTIGIS